MKTPLASTPEIHPLDRRLAPRRRPAAALAALLAAMLLGGVSARAATQTVTTTADSGAGSLRAAVASATTGDTINFNSSLNGQVITLTSGEILISKSLTITGPGASLLTVSGNKASRVLAVQNASGVTISGLTIANGKLVGGNGANAYDNSPYGDTAGKTGGGGAGGGGAAMGAGLLIDSNCVITLSDLVFATNSVQGGNGGGAVTGSNEAGAAGGAGSGPATGPTAAPGGFAGEAGGYAGAAGPGGAGTGGGGGGGGVGIGAPGSGGYGSFGGGGGGSGGVGYGDGRTPGGYSTGFGIDVSGFGDADGSFSGYSGGFGGTGASGGDDIAGGGGGGGAGLGAALFVWMNSQVTLSNVTFQANSALGGTGGSIHDSAGTYTGGNGQGKGAAIFVYASSRVTATQLTFSGDSSANAGSSAFATDGARKDNADVYGAFEAFPTNSPTVVYPAQESFTDGYSFYPSGDNGSYFYGSSYPLYSGETIDYVGTSVFNGITASSAMLFNLSAISGTVTSAKLRIHIANTAGSGNYLTVQGSTDNSWNAASAFPGGTITNIDANDTSGLDAGDWKEVDVTAFVNSRVTADKKASFILSGNNNQNANTDNFFEFDANTDSDASWHGPQLLVVAGPSTTAATVVLGNLNQTYDGTAKSVSVTTTPSGLANTVTYNGSATVPTNAGSYTVVAIVTAANYAGGATNTLVIAPAPQTINFAPLTNAVYGDTPFTLTATASSGLPVSYGSSDSSIASVSGSTVNVLAIGSTTLTASQAGDANYLPATSVTQTLVVEPLLINLGILRSTGTRGLATNAILTVTGNTSRTYEIIDSTNLLLPLANWTELLSTNLSATNIQIIVTTTNAPVMFYRLERP